MYKKLSTKKKNDILRASTKLITINNKTEKRAIGIGKAPEAIGRFFFKGCNLSLEISMMSFRMYTAEVVKQKINTAQQT